MNKPKNDLAHSPFPDYAHAASWLKERGFEEGDGKWISKDGLIDAQLRSTDSGLVWVFQA